MAAFGVPPPDQMGDTTPGYVSLSDFVLDFKNGIVGCFGFFFFFFKIHFLNVS